MPRPIALLLSLAALALVLAGCGNHSDEPKRIGETEGAYVEAGQIKYQVQISRILNPDDLEDRDFLLGVVDEFELASDETWFGVFLRAQNETDSDQQTASEFEIRDTQENVFRPLDVSKAENPFVYAATSLEPGGLLPAPDTASYLLPPRGELLVFKLPFDALQNRPLEFVIGDQAIVDLDV